MKKIIPLLGICTICLFTLQSCETQKIVINREMDTTNDGKMLLGTQTVDQFQKSPYSDWYTKEYDEYALDQNTIAALKKEKLQTYDILVFLGTWCGDSQREFPRLMKILNQIEYSEKRLEIVAVNRKKESPNGEDGRYNIQRVPTIIVSKYGKEIGRIIETPKSGYIEKDLLEIIQRYDASIKNLFKK